MRQQLQLQQSQPTTAHDACSRSCAMELLLAAAARAVKYVGSIGVGCACKGRVRQFPAALNALVQAPDTAAASARCIGCAAINLSTLCGLCCCGCCSAAPALPAWWLSCCVDVHGTLGTLSHHHAWAQHSTAQLPQITSTKVHQVQSSKAKACKSCTQERLRKHWQRACCCCCCCSSNTTQAAEPLLTK